MKQIPNTILLSGFLCANIALAQTQATTSNAPLEAEKASANQATAQTGLEDTQTEEYLLANPEALEKILARKVLAGDTEKLSDYLAIYQKVPNRDESLIDWGNAVVAGRKGDLKQSIRLYRKINSALPNLMPIRFQLAIALFYDKQYIAAQNEFEKLRSAKLPDEYLKAVNSYLDAIAKQSEWDINLSTSYVYDKNLNNAPPLGTKVTFPNGAELVSEKTADKGHGLKYSFGAEKRKIFHGNWFAAAHFDLYGAWYFSDAKKYNDLTAKVGTGIGYANATTEVELIPFYARQWSADNSRSSGRLKPFNVSWGARLEMSQWLSSNFRYQGALEFGRVNYKEGYKNLNGNNYAFSNTLLYMRNPQQYWFSGLTLTKKDIKLKSNSYRSIGTRIGWGQEWGKGISTRLSLGYTRRNYDDIDFLSIKKKNNEYSVNMSIWNRNWHFWGITPRLSLDYQKVNSNHPFYDYKNTNVFLDFTKTF